MAASPEQDLSRSTKLAVERTRLAHERTLMAWVRTATSLISFGFTIYKFFEYLRESQGPPTGSAKGPRQFAVVMIGIGITHDSCDHRSPPEHARVAYRIRCADPLLACHRGGRADWDPGRHSAGRRPAPNVAAKRCCQRADVSLVLGGAGAWRAPQEFGDRLHRWEDFNAMLVAVDRRDTASSRAYGATSAFYTRRREREAGHGSCR